MLNLNDPTWELVARYAINTATITTFIFGMYCRRYSDRELATTASMSNIFAFAVLTILSSVQYSVAAGFGLISLCSEQIEKIEIAYFFGAIALAMISSVRGNGLVFVILVPSFVLVAAYILDHPKMMQWAHGTKLTLDAIDPTILSDIETTRAALSERLGVDVMTFQIIELNYVNDMARINIFYRN